MINLDHVHFQQSFILYQTFGNIYTIAPFCKHALRVFTQLCSSFCSRMLRQISHLFYLSAIYMLISLFVVMNLIDDSSYGLNVDLGNKNKIQQESAC